MTRPHSPSRTGHDKAAQAAVSRRVAMFTLGTAALACGLPLRATAQSPDAAAALVSRAVGDVLGIINSGRSESAMLREFERIFRDYADVPIIAQSVVGPQWRGASDADRRAFIAAFQSYMARKYGRRFREFIGGEITVTGTRQVRNFVEVISTVRVTGTAPFEVRWLVSDGSGPDPVLQHDHRGREPDDHGALGNRCHARRPRRRSRAPCRRPEIHGLKKAHNPAPSSWKKTSGGGRRPGAEPPARPAGRYDDFSSGRRCCPERPSAGFPPDRAHALRPAGHGKVFDHLRRARLLRGGSIIGRGRGGRSS